MLIWRCFNPKALLPSLPATMVVSCCFCLRERRPSDPKIRDQDGRKSPKALSEAAAWMEADRWNDACVCFLLLLPESTRILWSQYLVFGCSCILSNSERSSLDRTDETSQLVAPPPVVVNDVSLSLGLGNPLLTTKIFRRRWHGSWIFIYWSHSPLTF